MASVGRNANMVRLVSTQRKVIAPEAELDGVSEGSAADDLHARTVTETHFKQATFQLSFAGDRNHAAGSADRQSVELNSLMR